MFSHSLSLLSPTPFAMYPSSLCKTWSFLLFTLWMNGCYLWCHDQHNNGELITSQSSNRVMLCHLHDNSLSQLMVPTLANSGLYERWNRLVLEWNIIILCLSWNSVTLRAGVVGALFILSDRNTCPTRLWHDIVVGPSIRWKGLSHNKHKKAL